MKIKRPDCSLSPKGRHSYNHFCLFVFTHKLIVYWQEFDVAPEMSGSLWCFSFEDDN